MEQPQRQIPNALGVAVRGGLTVIGSLNRRPRDVVGRYGIREVKLAAGQ